jgi:hypothetical protein
MSVLDVWFQPWLDDGEGSDRSAILRFLRGDQSMRLDLAERLMVYFNLEVRKRK